MLNDEPDAECYEAAIEADPVHLMSTATYLELSIVIESRYGEAGGRELDLWLHRAAVDLVAVHPEHAHRARLAYRQFGKGRVSRGASGCAGCRLRCTPRRRF
nr:PIN domain-containing protein [Nocardia terpenica]